MIKDRCKFDRTHVGSTVCVINVRPSTRNEMVYIYDIFVMIMCNIYCGSFIVAFNYMYMVSFN